MLFVVIDTLRLDHLSLYSDRVTTPALERLAAEGVRFDQAISVVPKTPASVASLLTSRYPIHHGVRTLYSPLPAAEETLAERFAARGYRTAALVDNPWIARGRGFEQGFARFRSYYDLLRPYGPLRYTSWCRLLDGVIGPRFQLFDGVVEAEAITEAALAELEQAGARPVFLYVHYFTPHWPYLPSEALAARYQAASPDTSQVNFPDRHGIDRGRMIFQNDLPEPENELARRLYRAEVDATLAQVGRLVEGVDARGLAESTLVVFTADHGHSLGEHDYHYHHGSFLYDAELRVPLVLRWTGALPEGRVVRAPVRSIDVAATVAELAGLEPLEGADGASLAPLWQGGDAAGREAFLESDVKMFGANTRRERDGVEGKLRGLRTGDYKLLLVPGRDGPSWQLFDLRADPGEERDLAGLPEHRGTVAALRARLLDWLPAEEREALQAAPDSAGSQAAPIDPREQQLLRELGYAE